MASSASDHPNVILFLMDDMGFGDCRVYNKDRKVATPIRHPPYAPRHDTAFQPVTIPGGDEMKTVPGCSICRSGDLTTEQVLEKLLSESD